MHGKVEQLLKILPDKDSFESYTNHMQALDGLCCMVITKVAKGESHRKFCHPTEVEQVIANVWNGWGVAQNGGATEAIATCIPSELVDALTVIGATIEATAIEKLAQKMEQFGTKHSDLSRDKYTEKFIEVRSNEWREEDTIFFSGNVPLLVHKYVCENPNEIMCARK